MAEDLNIVTPATGSRDGKPGDVPDRLRRRYLTDDRGGAGLGFYIDARTTAAAFRDHGARLTTSRNDPHVVRDLVAIAGHRGWTTIDVRGHSEFRRETWLQARASGLDVRGYRPTERDRQLLERRRRPQPDPQMPDDAKARLRVVEQVVRARIVEPAEQERVLAAARTRLAQWLDRGAHFKAPAKGQERSR